MTDLPPAITEALTAWHARDWYGLAVVNVVLVMRALTATELWFHVPKRWQWSVPVLLGAVHGWVGAYYEGATFGWGLLTGGSAALQIGLGAAGVHHALKRVKGSDLPRWPSAGAGLLVVLLLTGCASKQREACYAKAHREAHAYADETCPDWDACPEADRADILERYRADQEGCP